MQFVAVFVKKQDLAGPGLIDFTGEHLAHLLGVLLVDIRLLDIHDAALKVLTDVQDAAAAERGKRELLGVGVADLVIVVPAVLADLFESHLRCRILHLLDDLEVLVDFAGTLVDIDDDVEIVGRSVGLGNLGQEHVLEHAHHHRAVDVLLFLEVLEGVNQSNFFFFVHLYVVLFFVCKQFIGLFRTDSGSSDGEGIVFDVPVEGGEHGAVHIFAVGEVGSAFFVDGHFDVVVIVHVELDDSAGALCGGTLQYRFQFCSFHVT